MTHSSSFACLACGLLTKPSLTDPTKQIEHAETFEKRSILFKVKEDEDFDRRNTECILRIKIGVRRRDWAKEDVLLRSQGR